MGRIVTDYLIDKGQVSPYATTQSHSNYAVMVCTFYNCEYINYVYYVIEMEKRKKGEGH